MTYDPETKARLEADAAAIIARYPEGHARSALLPMHKPMRTGSDQDQNPYVGVPRD